MILLSKHWWQRFSVFLFLTASLGLVVLGKIHYPVTEQWRSYVVDTLVPFTEVLSSPVNAIQTIGRSINELFYLHEENLYLEREITKLRHETLLTKQIESENERLKELLNYVGVQKISFVTARVVTDSSGPFLRSIMINAGAVDGIRKGNAVMSDKGLIGRVIEVGEGSSRVLLVTDINSRLPVVMEKSRERAMVAGNNSEALDVMYLPRESKTKAGELAITSGDGKFFPSGLPVGAIYMEKDQQLKLLPLTDWSRLEYVSVVKQ